MYSAYADRLTRDRLMIATVLLPVPLIVLLRLMLLLHMPWVYFLLYTFVLAYGALLMLSWSVYVATHYDIQEAKRLIPFISSGLLVGAIVGGTVVVGGVALLGPANLLLLWVTIIAAGALLVRRIAQRYPMAVEPTVLLALSPEHFRQIVLEDPAMSFEIFRALSARIRRFDEAIQPVGG